MMENQWSFLYVILLCYDVVNFTFFAINWNIIVGSGSFVRYQYEMEECRWTDVNERKIENGGGIQDDVYNSETLSKIYLLFDSTNFFFNLFWNSCLNAKYKVIKISQDDVVNQRMVQQCATS